MMILPYHIVDWRNHGACCRGPMLLWQIERPSHVLQEVAKSLSLASASFVVTTCIATLWGEFTLQVVSPVASWDQFYFPNWATIRFQFCHNESNLFVSANQKTLSSRDQFYFLNSTGLAVSVIWHFENRCRKTMARHQSWPWSLFCSRWKYWFSSALVDTGGLCCICSNAQTPSYQCLVSISG